MVTCQCLVKFNALFYLSFAPLFSVLSFHIITLLHFAIAGPIYVPFINSYTRTTYLIYHLHIQKNIKLYLARGSFIVVPVPFQWDL